MFSVVVCLLEVGYPLLSWASGAVPLDRAAGGCKLAPRGLRTDCFATFVVRILQSSRAIRERNVRRAVMLTRPLS